MYNWSAIKRQHSILKSAGGAIRILVIRAPLWQPLARSSAILTISITEKPVKDVLQETDQTYALWLGYIKRWHTILQKKPKNDWSPPCSSWGQVLTAPIPSGPTPVSMDKLQCNLVWYNSVCKQVNLPIFWLVICVEFWIMPVADPECLKSITSILFSTILR